MTAVSRVTLGELAELVTKGTTPTSVGGSISTSGIPFLRINNISDGEINFQDIQYVDKSTHESLLSRSVIRPGDFLITIAGTIGKTLIVPDNYSEMNCNQAIAIIRLKPAIDKSYLKHWIGTEDALKQINGAKVTATISNLSLGQIKELKIPLPGIKEQKRIAAILDKADAIRRKRQQAIQLADDFLRAVFLDMFGDPVTNTQGWEVKTLNDVCKKITDGTHHSPSIVNSGVPYITAKHLKKTGLQFFENPWFISEEDHRAIFSRCDPEIGDVLYIKDGATTGLAAINNYDFEFSMLSSLALLKPDRKKILPEFLVMFLNDPATKRVMIANMAGAAITRLTLAKIKSVLVPAPPIEMQQQFTDIYLKVLATALKISIAVDASSEAFDAISQKAFSGEL